MQIYSRHSILRYKEHGQLAVNVMAAFHPVSNKALVLSSSTNTIDSHSELLSAVDHLLSSQKLTQPFHSLLFFGTIEPYPHCWIPRALIIISQTTANIRARLDTGNKVSLLGSNSYLILSGLSERKVCPAEDLHWRVITISNRPIVLAILFIR